MYAIISEINNEVVMGLLIDSTCCTADFYAISNFDFFH